MDPLCAVFDSPGKWLATGSHRSVKTWTMTPPDPEAKFAAVVEGNVSSVAFGPKARWLAAGSEDGTLRLWDMQAWEDGPRTFKVFMGPVVALAFDPNGKWLVAGGIHAKALKIWSLAPTVDGPTELGRHKHVMRKLSFSADGRWLAAAGDTDAIMLWNLDQGAPKLTALRYREPNVTALAFDPTSKLLAFGCTDGTIYVQELSALEIRPMRISAHHGFVTALYFDPKGGRLASGGEDGMVRIWRLNIEELIDLSCMVAGRNLTCDEWEGFMGERPYAPTCSDLPYPSCPAASLD
jgi:WD40 repeat protein